MVQTVTLKARSLAEASRKIRLLDALGASLDIRATGEWKDRQGRAVFGNGINSVVHVTPTAVFAYTNKPTEQRLFPASPFQVIIEATFRESAS